MKVKEKNNTWFIWLAAGAVILGIAIQLMLGYAQELKSRWDAQQAVHGFTARAGELAADINERDRALFDRLSASYELAMPAKREGAQERALLTLVNPWNSVPEGYAPQLTAIDDEQAVDSRCADELLRMLEDCKAAGCLPYVCSSYRTQEMQEFLYNNKIDRLINEGYSYYDAPEVAARSVAVPGTSEHQLGLAVDIIDEYYPYLNYYQENTYTQQWLMEHCYDYGFILRYPNGTTDITGIIYEPWHYRYVGYGPAQEIKALGVTFEEYIVMRRGR